MKRLSRRIESPPVTLDDLTPSPDCEGFDPAYPNLKFGLINRIIRFDRNSRYQLPRNNMETSDIVMGVLEALKQTDVWKWCEEQMSQQQGPKGQGHGLGEGELGPNLEEQAGEYQEGYPHRPYLDGHEDEEMDLDDVGDDLGNAEDDLQNAQMDEVPLRESQYASARRYMASGRTARERLSRRGDTPEQTLIRYEARFKGKGSAHSRYKDVRGYRGRLTESPEFQVEGYTTNYSQEPVGYKDMADKLQTPDGPLSPYEGESPEERSRREFYQKSHPDDSAAAHKAGKNESVYETAKRAQAAAVSAAKAWIEKGDCSQAAKREAAKYVRDEDRQIDHYQD
jgi:hypothetical protein